MIWNSLSKFISRIESRSQVILAMIGLGLVNAHGSYLYAVTSRDFQGLMVSNELTSAIIFCGLGVLAMRCPPLDRRGVLLVGAPLCAAAGMIMLSNSSSTLMANISSVLLTIGTSALIVMWLELASSLPVMDIVAVVIGSSLLHAIRSYILESGVVIAVSFSVFAVCASAILLVFASYHASFEPSHTQVSSAEKHNMLMLACWSFLFAFIWGYGLDVSVSSPNATIETIGSCVPSLLILLWLLVVRRPLNVKVLCTLTVPLIVLGFIFVLLPDMLGQGRLLLQIGSEGCYILLMVVACGIAYTSHLSGGFLGGMTMGAVCIGLFLGSMLRIIGVSLSLSETFIWIITTASAFAFAALTIVLFFSNYILFSSRSIDNIVSRRGSTEERLDKLITWSVETYGLTPSEEKVLTLIAKGMSRESIAEELFISPATLRVHISHLCKKMHLQNISEFDRLVQEALS